MTIKSNLSAVSVDQSAANTGARILVETLIEMGVDTVFGYTGAKVLPVFDELEKVCRVPYDVSFRNFTSAVETPDKTVDNKKKSS